MSARKDLTRWNRAGLSRFRYVEGNAVEYLEALRQQLHDKFGDSETGLCAWLNPAEKTPDNEKAVETENLTERQERLSRRQERIVDSYHQDRRDWAWEISRTFARACHVLTEHTNAYSNEAYLGTATQWDHLRRLVEMLDYHPAPPASATTPLAFIAKDNGTGEGGRAGIVGKGFQVKYSPENGGAKIVFETLEDLTIDPALNALRPKGWDQSDEPAARPGINDGTDSTAEERQFSLVANGPVINIQGVGPMFAAKLDLHSLAGSDGFKVRNFVDLDPDNSQIDIATNLLREWKAKAELLIDFAPDANWSVIEGWLLSDIADASVEFLAEQSGNSMKEAEALKLDVEIVSICLDQPLFEQIKLKDLFAPFAAVAGSVDTTWHAERKPEVVADDVAMVMVRDETLAEAVMIESVDHVSADADLLDIRLLPSRAQFSWKAWSRGKTTLRYSPRWKKKCWLNGTNVIRTKLPHGFSAGVADDLTEGAFIGWDPDRKNAGKWNYSGIRYARVIEADKRNIRLEYDGILPDEDTDLVELLPVDANIVSSGHEVIVLLGDPEEGGDVSDPVEHVPIGTGDSPSTDSIFTITELPPPDPSGGGLLPPASLPKIGSFLFPSPFLPVDLVKAAVELLLNLGMMQIPSSEEFVIKGLPFGDLLDGAQDLNAAANSLFDLLDAMTMKDENDAVVRMVHWVDTEKNDTIMALENLLAGSSGSETSLFQKIREGVERKGPLLTIPKEPPIKAVVDSIVPRYVIEGDANKVKSGDWVIGEFSDALRALQIADVTGFTDEDKAERFSLRFENLVGNVGELQKVYADFRGELVAEGAAVNITPVDPDNIELEQVPESLSVGQDVFLTTEGEEPVAAKIGSIKGNSITTSPPATGYTKGDLVILGNVVIASHGKSKPEKILGSGDASRSNQEFTLEVDQVSFTPDATKSSGVAAAMDVIVEGRVWEQVSTLKDSTPGDHHYAVRMTEDGYVKILFGDGDYGRRLPTGTNNIRVRYRVGSGLAGNVPANALEKPVKPHPRIDTVIQPLPAAGGGDMEDVASLRENAPPTLLALERAVSLSDFSHLAAAQSSVWQARAYSQILHGGRAERVAVVIVPAGGVQSAQIRKTIRSFLQKHALPGVQVSVEPFVEERVSLSVTVRVKTDEFVAEEVQKDVATALVDHFTLQNRKLGEHFYLSEVYMVVEGVQGVENSVCVLNEDASLQLVRATDESTIVYLDTDAETDPSRLEVAYEEYLP